MPTAGTRLHVLFNVIAAIVFASVAFTIPKRPAAVECKAQGVAVSNEP